MSTEHRSIVEELVRSIRAQADLIDAHSHGEVTLRWQDGKVVRPVTVALKRDPAPA